jgi:subtilisin family serine protease
VRRNSFEPSSYSNRGDVAIMGNGIAVFGGEAQPPEASARGSGAAPQGAVSRGAASGPADGADDPWVTVDGVVGAFSAEALPLGGGRNTSGWASWAGTSFATPIVAGLAADVLTREPDLGPARVIERVRVHAQLTDDPYDRDGPLDCPTIIANQVQAPPARPAAP